MITPKVAYLEIDCDIDDFYAEWESKHTVEPTEQDYDEWAYAKAESFINSHKYTLIDFIKLK